MKKNEFVKYCVALGYADAATVKKYIADNKKSDYTDDDAVAVYRKGYGRETINTRGGYCASYLLDDDDGRYGDNNL